MEIDIRAINVDTLEWFQVKLSDGSAGIYIRKPHVLDLDIIEAEPVRHGHWEFYPDDNHLRCSVCRLEFLREKMPATRIYCPSCGTKMDLKE